VSWFRLFDILMACNGRHADVMIGSWIRSGTKELVTLGVEMLGHLHILRAVGPLVRLLDSTEDAALTRECSAALARIGSPDAMTRLLGAPLESDDASGLVYGAVAIPDESSFANVIDYVIEEDGPLSYLAIRAIGRRQMLRFEPSVLAALDAPEALTRACAALALARLGRADATRLRVANAQAATEKERLFSALALIAIDVTQYPEMETPLRADLAIDSFALLSHLQADVLDVLRGTNRPDATALAEAWAPFYRHVRP
jgi:HEAT repeat protein